MQKTESSLAMVELVFVRAREEGMGGKREDIFAVRFSNRYLGKSGGSALQPRHS